MNVCLLLVQNSALPPRPPKSSLINSLKHLTLHRSGRHTSTCPSVWESSLLQMGQMADTRGCSVSFGQICCPAAHGTALLTKPRMQTVSGKHCMAQPQPLFGQHLAPLHLPACSALGSETSIFLALIPCAQVIPWKRVLVWQHSPVPKTYSDQQETLTAETVTLGALVTLSWKLSF